MLPSYRPGPQKHVASWPFVGVGPLFYLLLGVWVRAASSPMPDAPNPELQNPGHSKRKPFKHPTLRAKLPPKPYKVPMDSLDNAHDCNTRACSTSPTPSFSCRGCPAPRARQPRRTKRGGTLSPRRTFWFRYVFYLKRGFCKTDCECFCRSA